MGWRLGAAEAARKWRTIGLGAVGLAVAYSIWSAYGSAAGHDPQARLGALESDKARLEKEYASAKSELAVLERQLQMERAGYADLTKQLRALSEENAQLREEAAVMQAVAGRDAKLDSVRLGSVRIEPVGAAGEYAYRILLLQTGERARPFQGSYQLVISTVQDGARRGFTLPPAPSKSEVQYQLQFVKQQRIEGTFKVDPGATVRSVQVRVFESGNAQPKAMQTVTLS